MFRSIFLKLFTLAAVILTMVSCSDDKGDLNLNFKLTYDDAPMVMFQEYDYPSGGKFFLSRASFYISDISLDEEIIKEIDYIDLTNSHASAEAAAEGLDYKILEIPAGSYGTFKFAYGVPAADNAKNWAEFPADNALSRSGEYWDAWTSFVFFKLEGMADLDGDGIFDQGISLHIGGDEVFAELNASVSTEISADAEASKILRIAVDEVFNNNGQIYDLENNSALHSKVNHLGQMQELMTNIAAATTLQN